MTEEETKEANENYLCDRLNQIHRICCSSTFSIRDKLMHIEELSDGFDKIPDVSNKVTNGH